MQVLSRERDKRRVVFWKVLWALLLLIAAFLTIFYYSYYWRTTTTKKVNVYVAIFREYMWELNSQRMEEISKILFSTGEMCAINITDERGSVLFSQNRCYEDGDIIRVFLSMLGLWDVSKYHRKVFYGNIYIGDIEFRKDNPVRFVSTLILLVYILMYLLIVRYIDTAYMKKKLQSTNEELNNTLERLKNTIEELKRTKEELVRQEKFRSLARLMAQIAHDINTPLGVAYTSISELEKEINALENYYESGNLTEIQFQEFLDVSKELVELIKRNIARSHGLIHNFKRITNYEITEEIEEVDIVELIEDVIKAYGKKLERQNVNVEVNGVRRKVLTYPGAIIRIISNLIDNSLIHGFEGDGGQIHITVFYDDDKVVIDYRDSGKGVPPEFKDRIFEPFFTRFF